jgi:hypothetical protein
MGAGWLCSAQTEDSELLSGGATRGMICVLVSEVRGRQPGFLHAESRVCCGPSVQCNPPALTGHVRLIVYAAASD